ncbi:MAG: hypothetical protein K6A33_00595, partial [Clostridiales bacterium]|nr:hypothetical protein [Clostridiales bacterium]
NPFIAKQNRQNPIEQRCKVIRGTHVEGWIPKAGTALGGGDWQDGRSVSPCETGEALLSASRAGENNE